MTATNPTTNPAAVHPQVRTPLPGSQKVAAPAADPRLEVTLLLRHRPGAPPLPTLEQIVTPGWRPIDRERFTALFGAAAEEIDRVAAFARNAGLEVAAVEPAQRIVKLAGPASRMGAAFQVTFEYHQMATGVHRRHTRPPTLPAELEGIVEGVIGLDDLPALRRRHARTLAPAAHPASAGQYGSQQGGAPHLTQPVLNPLQLAGLYEFPPYLDGTGERIALLEFGGGYDPAEMYDYFKRLGIFSPPQLTAIGINGAGNTPVCQQNMCPDSEVVLDIQVAGGISPGAELLVYFAPSFIDPQGAISWTSSKNFFDALSAAIHDREHTPDVVSISWGNPEENWPMDEMLLVEQRLIEAAMLGVSVVAASGDYGSFGSVPGIQSRAIAVDFPASDPWLTSCGGTQLVTNPEGMILNEIAWNSLPQAATGGGISALFPKPVYQQGSPVTPSPANGFAGRGHPDVAGFAAAYAVHFDGKPQVMAGTSAVAPLWAGLTARLNQGLGRKLGFLNGPLYLPQVRAVLRQITYGDNGLFRAGPEWNACTGLGRPLGTALLEALQGIQ